MAAFTRWTRRSVLSTLPGLALALTACQRQATEATDQPPDSPSEAGSQAAAPSSISLNGAGASFPQILYQRWFTEYNTLYPQIQVNYQSVGSAAGVQQFLANTVDFAASDIALTDDEIAAVSQGAVMLPMTAGSVVIVYNLGDIASGLKLSRSVYTDIFLGKITQWNDPQIATLNPDLNLPNLPITLIHRSDGSGTTATLTRHLSAISSEWQEQVGSGVSVSWPAGVGAKGNEGVSAQVQLVPGVIAYVEFAYAKELDLSVAALENQAGAYTLPTLETSEVALSEVDLPENLRAFVSDPSSPDAYPIVTYTWILVYRTYADPAKAKTLKQVLNWALTEGQSFSQDLGYLPLPPDVVTRTQAALDSIT